MVQVKVAGLLEKQPGTACLLSEKPWHGLVKQTTGRMDKRMTSRYIGLEEFRFSEYQSTPYALVCLVLGTELLTY